MSASKRAVTGLAYAEDVNIRREEEVGLSDALSVAFWTQAEMARVGQ